MATQTLGLSLAPQDPIGGEKDSVSKQALFRLLGQDLDICLEAHADAYDRAREKWSDCSFEEWTKGADGMRLSLPTSSGIPYVNRHIDLAGRFSVILNFVCATFKALVGLSLTAVATTRSKSMSRG